MVELKEYTGRQIKPGACPVCGEMDDMCAAKDPSIAKTLPPQWKVQKLMSEHYKKKLGMGNDGE